MDINNEPMLDAPIPGQSLTHELGARPWQTPAQYTTVEEALDYYIPRFANDDVTEQLLDVLETGVPVSTLANTIQLAGVMEGKHSIDVGMLVIPVLMELIMYMADEEGIEYNTGLEKDEDIRSTQIQKALVRLQEESEAQAEEAGSPEEDETTNEIVTTMREVATERATGLMGRRG
tara:strand:- start:876 stop:1403 length:528 start_codon:yes stop_codon:yes gene_type:complete